MAFIYRGSFHKLKTPVWWILPVVLLILPLASWLRRIAQIYGLPDGAFQHDASVYYRSAVAWSLGENPFVTTPYVYPPLTLPFWKLFSDAMPYATFYNSFLITKGICAIFLVWLWKRFFEIKGEYFYLFALLAFYKTMDVDLWSGNITIFETTLLYLGFIAFLKERNDLFVGFVVAAAFCKITPILFLGLLPLSPHPKRFRFLLAGCLCFGAFLLLNFAIYPADTLEFFRLAWVRTDESGWGAPSTYAVLRATHHYFSQRNPDLARFIRWDIFYYLSVAVIAGISFQALRKLRARGPIRDQITVIFFFAATYLLVLPRVKNYSFVLVIPAAYYLLDKIIRRSPQLFWPLFLLPLLAISGGDLPFLFFFHEIVKEYFAWFFLFLVWAFSFPLLKAETKPAP